MEGLHHESHAYQSELRNREEERQQWKTQMNKMAAELARERKRVELCQQQRKSALVRMRGGNCGKENNVSWAAQKRLFVRRGSKFFKWAEKSLLNKGAVNSVRGQRNVC